MQKISVNRIKSVADRNYNKAEDAHLLETIRFRMANGFKPLLQPIALQPLTGDPDYDYVVDDGRRRFKSLLALEVKELELGQDAVVIDGDSEINAYLGNQHTELALAEEITKLHQMREKFETLDALASAIGHSATWVARRLNLLNLCPLWKQAMTEKTFGFLALGHYETIATFPENIQEEIFNYVRSEEGRNALKGTSIIKFAQILYDRYATLLSALPWEETGCGECPTCKERASGGWLFAKLIPDARCMNHAYLERKRQEYVAAQAAKEPETVLVSQSFNVPNSETTPEHPLAGTAILPPGDWRPAEKGEDGAVEAIIADGPQAGTKTLIKRPEATAKAKPIQRSSSLAERREALNKKRQKKTIDKLIAFIEKKDYEIPGRKSIVAMVAAKGIGAVNMSQIMNYKNIVERDDIYSLLWNKVTGHIISELKTGQEPSTNPKWEEARLVSDLIDFDVDKAFSETVTEIPEPKSWAALERKEKKEAEVAAEPEAQAA